MSDRLKVKVNFKRHHCEIFDTKAIMIITRCLGGLLLVYKVAVPIFFISWDFWTLITLGTTIGSIFASDLWELWFILDLSRIPNQMISEKNVVMNEMKITADWLLPLEFEGHLNIVKLPDGVCFRMVCCGIIGDRNTGCFLPTVVVGEGDCGWSRIYSKMFHNLKAEAGFAWPWVKRFSCFSCSDMPSDAHWRFDHGSSDAALLFLRESPCLTLFSSPNDNVWTEHTQSSERERVSTLSQMECLKAFNVIVKPGKKTNTLLTSLVVKWLLICADYCGSLERSVKMGPDFT